MVTLLEPLHAVEDSVLSELIFDQYVNNGAYNDIDEAYDASRRLSSAVVDVVLGSSWVEVTTDADSGLTQSAFMHGGCAYVAGELHRVAGLPLVRFTSPDDKFGWRGHWAVRGNDAYLDIRGLVAEGEVLADFSGGHAWTVESHDGLYAELLAQVGAHARTVVDDLGELEQALIRRYVGQLLEVLNA